MLRLSLLILLPALLISSADCESQESDLVDEGRRLYQTTTRSDGTSIRALVQHDVPLPAGLGACSNCHRRSGFGVSEGGSRSLNLTAPALFNAAIKPPIRPAYDDQSLIRAIVAGVASDGRELHPTMPRYELSTSDAAALTAYLRTLGAARPDGVGEKEVTIATIVTDSAPVFEREAVTEVLQEYVELRNNESRHESDRAAASNRHYYGRTRQRAFRRWKLHVWNLSGPESTWRKQLDAYYAEQKPFAVVSGTAGSDWLTVHEFCEAREIPCLLPLSDGPATADDDFYSLYYSTGPVLEAGVIANHLKTSELSRDTRVLVVHRNDARSRRALEALSNAAEENGFTTVESIAISGRKSMSKRKWRKLLQTSMPVVLIAWLPQNLLATLFDPNIDDALLPDVVYTSNTFTSWSNAENLPRSRIKHIYPYSLASRGLSQFPREYLWLKRHELSDLDPVAAAKVLYACRVLGVGLADIQSNFSREYLLESLEHALDGTQMTSLFPRTSLGPNQRLLSRGAYVVDPAEVPDSTTIRPVWVQP